MAATNQIASWWALPRGETAAAWIANYQASLEAPHRAAISRAMAGLTPETLFEIGCHCGPNLIRLAGEHPGLEAIGIDPSAEAIAAGRQWVKAQGYEDRVSLSVGQMPGSLYALPSEAFDVVLTSYALAYIAPSDLDATLYEIGRLAARAVVIAEPMAMDGLDEARHGSLTGYHEWRHDYRERVRWIGSLAGADVELCPVNPPADRLNGLLVLRKQ